MVNKMEKLIIRKARLEEFDSVLPDLAARAYGDRFFDDKTIKNNTERVLKIEGLVFPQKEREGDEFLEYGGSLSIPFTCLKPQPNGSGQSFESFRRYWTEKKSDEGFRAYVAELNGKVVGFVKGSFGYVDCAEDFPEANLPETDRIVSLGSLYLDPDCRRGGIGTELVKKYMEEALIEKPDCKGFVTDCYWRNNSQYFFNKLGASSVGFCNIPDAYLDGNLERKTQNIVGEVMFWNREKIDTLLGNQAIKSGEILADAAYTRNTSEYSLMVAAGGDMEEFKAIKAKNLGYWASRVAETSKEIIKGGLL